MPCGGNPRPALQLRVTDEQAPAAFHDMADDFFLAVAEDGVRASGTEPEDFSDRDRW